MKILVVCQYYYPEPFRINDICETLVQHGHDVTVLTGLPNYPKGIVPPEYRRLKKRHEEISGVKVIRCALFGRGKGIYNLCLNYISFAITSTIRSFFLENDFDVVYVHQLSPITMACAGIKYAKQHKKKLFWYCLDIWPESIAAARIQQSSPVYRILLRISKKLYKKADHIAVSSYSFIDYLECVIGYPKGKMSYLPQYAESLFINVVSKDDGNTNLVFAGNIGEMQSVETIINAANLLKANNRIHWHIVGDGSSRIRCEILSRELGLLDCIHFYGQRPVHEMIDFYSMASAMLVTMKADNHISATLPGKVQSYMAAGKPIIGAIDGESSRVVKMAECGLVTNAENVDGLAELVTRFISEENKHGQWGRNAREYYTLNFSKDAFIDFLEAKLS